MLLIRLETVLDEWDSCIADALTAGRRVITVNPPGAGGSTRRVPRASKGMADTTRAFISALGLIRIDLMRFSLRGFIAQQAALEAPSLVRRLVLTNTGPAGGRGVSRPTGMAYVYIDMLCVVLARTDAKEFLFSPCAPEGKATIRNYLARIRGRVMD